MFFFFFSSRRRHTRCSRDWSSDVCSSDLGRGPRHSLFALGYAGWAPGQLDAEIQANGWLSVAADDDIVFNPDHDGKWRRALAKLGIDLSMLSTDAGHA